MADLKDFLWLYLECVWAIGKWLGPVVMGAFVLWELFGKEGE